MSEKFIIANNYCREVFDGTHDTPKPSDHGYKLVTSKNIIGNKLDLNSAYLISQEDYLAINKRSKVSQFDVLFSMIGSVGNVYIEQRKNEEIDYSIKNIGVFSSKTEKEAYWLYYYLQSPYAQSFIKKFLNGAVQKFLPLQTLRAFPILSPVENYESLISILKNIDQKITLNNQINEELEAMAKTLYDYWFVQFDFPDQNGKPYKSSGGKMVYNPELKREIPEGWGVEKLGDISQYVSEKVGSSELNKENYVGTDNMIADMGGIELTTSIPKSGTSTKFSVGDILISNIRPYFKKIWLSDRTGGCSADVLCIRTNRIIYKEFVYATLARDDFFNYDVAGSKGSKMPRGDKKHIMEYPIVFEFEIADQFSKIVRPIYEAVHKNYNQNQELTQLRDWLLPMLMNGQARVEDKT
ncbi:restriction endonuclease subunit S [Streptococcus parasuis]|uniref:restriction endonuclease subunit S n=1 Tax=Streptococcus parasuis TaxID=1501662 RepID=UPI0023783989|nr:restriction endonuclease subunit S [Streptococcus parasuis]WDN59293.1 restriction endonuclease subunit S [Streptococcus parasuis]WDN61126.1 restriction endonuclease subunit S [Streptococcus parasuis]